MSSWDNPSAATDRNELVFANRNTIYGAFQLRREYNKRVLIAFAITIVVFIILVLIMWLPSLSTVQEDLPPIVIDQKEINIEQKKDDPIPPPPEQPKPLIELVAFVPPVVRNNAVEDTTQIIVQPEEDKNISNVNQKGDDELVINTPTVAVVEEKKEPEIFVYVSEMPDFPGGLQALYKYVGTNINYPEEAKDAGISGKCYLRFVVTESGRVGKIEVQKGVPGCPQCDKEAVRVVKTLPEFKPGKNNGQAVPVWFQLPINFTLK
ncbi:MAG: energy transducer TonB [Bacteroidia bacterium]|nr:energy transducer TonB [Bacteroidia bacterium]